MRHRGVRVAFASLFGSVFAALAIAAIPSVAAASTDPTGYIEICKTFTAGPSGSPAFQGTFNYTITSTGGTSSTATLRALQGGPQACTAPIAVSLPGTGTYTGDVTVTETGAPWFSVSSISATPGDPGTVSGNTATGVATLTVLPAPAGSGDYSLADTVQYTNAPVYGTIEVCKQAASGSGALSGSYTFNVTTADAGVYVFDSATGAYDLPWSTTATAVISSAGLGCSAPILVPAGSVTTVEPGTTSVTAITATSNSTNELTSSTLGTGTATSTVLAGNTTNQTIVTYTDALSTVKLCKAWTGTNTIPTTSFGFTVTSAGPAGPTAVTAAPSLTAGPVGSANCVLLGAVRTGTQVNITENIVPGTKVAAIDVSPTANSQGNSPIVSGSRSLPNRTISIIAGAGETVVTYTDEPATAGQLKICVAPTATPVAGTVPFTVNGSQTINVALSATAVNCTLDNTATFAYDGAVTIAGGALPTTDAYGPALPTVVPTNVEVLENGVLTATNQASLVASTVSSATVLMSEGIITEVTFTVDPPVAVTASTPVVTVTSSPAGTSAPVVTATPTVTSSPTVTAAPTVTSTAGATSNQGSSAAAKVQKLHQELNKTKSEIKSLQKQLHHHLSKHARAVDTKKLTALRHQLAKLQKELKG